MKSLRHLLFYGCLIACMATTTLFTSAATPSAVDPSTGEGEMTVTITRDPARFNVTIPTSLPVYVDETGKVTVSQDTKIVNESYGNICISQIHLNSKNDWMITSWGTSVLPLDAKKFALQFVLSDQMISTSVDSASELIFTDASRSKIVLPGILNEELESNRSMIVKYDTRISPQSKKIDNLQIADVIFTVGWAEGD